MLKELKLRFVYLLVHLCEKTPSLRDVSQINSSKKLTMNSNIFNCNLMSNVWATMPYVQLSHKMFVNCIDNRQNQLFSEMSLRDVMELPLTISETRLNHAQEARITISETRLNHAQEDRITRPISETRPNHAQEDRITILETHLNHAQEDRITIYLWYKCIRNPPQSRPGTSYNYIRKPPQSRPGTSYNYITGTSHNYIRNPPQSRPGTSYNYIRNPPQSCPGRSYNYIMVDVNRAARALIRHYC